MITNVITRINKQIKCVMYAEKIAYLNTFTVDTDAAIPRIKIQTREIQVSYLVSIGLNPVIKKYNSATEMMIEKSVMANPA